MALTPCTTLTTLIAAYSQSVTFEEATPNAYRMAKLFCEMQWSNGGLVLLGVRADGLVTGIAPADVDAIYQRFAILCSRLTTQRVEIGTLHVSSKCVVFLVFNTMVSHTAPLDRYRGQIDRVAFL
jgi:hypothetical protein